MNMAMKRTTLPTVLASLSLALCAQAWSLPGRVWIGTAGMGASSSARTVGLAEETGKVWDEVFRWKWAEGQVLRYRTTQEMSWVMGSGGNGGGGGVLGNPESKNEWTIVYEVKQEVTQVDEDGIATVEQTYESAKIIAEDAEEQVRYDSKKPSDKSKKDHRLIKPFAAFVGKTITFRVGPEGKVHSLEGASEILDEALSATGDANPLVMGITAMFRASLSDESVRKGLEQQLRVVPDKAVEIGDTWSITSEQSMPLVGTLQTDVEYKLKRVRPGRRAMTAAIEVSGAIKQKDAAPAPGGAPGQGLLGGLKLATLTESKINGDIVFDVTYGRIEQSSLNIAMTFKIGLGKMLGAGSEMIYTMKQRGDMQLLSAR